MNENESNIQFKRTGEGIDFVGRWYGGSLATGTAYILQ